MHADFDDAPHYRLKNRNQTLRMTVITLISAAVILGSIEFLAPKLITVKAVTKVAPPVVIQEPQRTIAQPVIRPAPIQQAIQIPTEAPKPNTKKQTVNKDKNYVSGQKAIDILRFDEPKRYEEPAANAPTKMRVTIVGEETRAEDYCPGAAGSIQKRNCRRSVNIGSRNN